MAEHRPVRSESLQPYTERSSRPGSELPSAEADVYVWHYALLVVHARKEEDLFQNWTFGAKWHSSSYAECRTTAKAY